MTASSKTPPARGSAPALSWLWALGAAARLIFIWIEPPTRPVADETMWLMALTRIKDAGFSPFSNYPIFHPPAYPYFLASIQAVFGTLLAIKGAQALLGSLIIPATGRIASRLFGPRAGVAAAALVALYPEFIWYSAHFWCETLFIALLWWAIERLMAADAWSSSRAAAVGGALFGVAILTRETVLYLLPLAVAWLAVAKPQWRPGLAATALLTALAVVVPWTARNWIQFGAFIPVSTGGGLNLYQGNAGISRDEVYVEYYKADGKVEQFERARAAGLRAILKRQPGWLLEKIRDEGPRLAEADSLALIHIRRGAYENRSCGGYRFAAALVLIPWVLLVAVAIVATARLHFNRHTVLLLGLVASYLLLHIATHGFSRYRLPIVPGLMIVAASLAEMGCLAGRTLARRTLLLGLAMVAAFLLAPSLLDQAGYLGLLAPPDFEGFPPVCPPGS